MDKPDDCTASIVFKVPDDLKSDLEAIHQLVYAVAQRYERDGTALLTLLRALETYHQEIREGFFQDALPQSRHQLYSFLRDMEAEGGWPYIPRMKLRSLLEYFDAPLEDEVESDRTDSDPVQSPPELK